MKLILKKVIFDKTKKMTVDNLNDFEKLILENDVFEDVVFNIENCDLKVRSFKSQWITFNNCTFICKKISIININDDKLDLEFNNCTFNCDVYFDNCVIDKLIFLNTKSIKSFKIFKFKKEKKNEINSFKFSYSLDDKNNKERIPELACDFSFNNIFFKKYFEFNNVKNIKGIFSFSDNIVGDNLFIDSSSCVFNSSELSNINFKTNKFNTYTSFKNSKFYFNKDNFSGTGSIWHKSIFYDNTFQKLNFSNIDLFSKLEFDNCDFLETTLFEDWIKNENSNLRIIACKFEKYTLFDNSFFDKIEISHTKFVEKVSFENFSTNFFKIHQVSFLGSAFFDDLNKDNNKSIENWDRKTLRSIKRELVSTHNQIDYLRFKAYELEAYKKEKGKSWKDNFILNLNSFSSSNGLDWVKALRFIFLTSLINYLFYLITYLISVKSVVPSNFPNSVEEFFVYYLKFINPLMFLKSPIEDAEKYFFPLLFLLLGKILISYGIYQLIQAFRKFGKNGD